MKKVKIIDYKFVQCDNGHQFISKLRYYESKGWILDECSLSQKWFKIKKENN